MEEPSDISQPVAVAPASRITKAATVTKLLSRNRGATLPEIMSATNWQPHSSRAFLAGLRKRGLVLLREACKDGQTSWRIQNQ
jgi:hypothetical protein